MVLDVGARVALDSVSEQQDRPAEHVFLAPRTEVMTGKPTVVARGATATSLVSDVLGEDANCTTFPYMLLTGVCNLVGE